MKMLRNVCCFLLFIGCWVLYSNAKADVCAKFQFFDDADQSARILQLEHDGRAQWFNNQNLVAGGQYYLVGSSVIIQDLDDGEVESFQLNKHKNTLTRQQPKRVMTLDGIFSCPSLPNLAYLSHANCLSGRDFECCPEQQKSLCVALESRDISLLETHCKSSALACKKLLDVYIKQAFDQTGMSETLMLDETNATMFANACIQYATVRLCSETAKILWRTQRFQLAKALLQTQCNHQVKTACDYLDALKHIVLPSSPIQTNSLPCGTFTTVANSPYKSFVFKQKSMVNDGLKARIEANTIKIRHNLGGDFMMVMLDEHTLIALDGWNPYVIYTKVVEKSSCSKKTLAK